MKRVFALLCFFLLGIALPAQQPGVPRDIVANQITLPLSSPPQMVSSGSARVLGNPGNGIYYYWVVANFPIGNSSPAGPFVAINAPAVLSSSDAIQVSWSPVPGATSYDVLRTSTPQPPAGNCDCAIAIATPIANITDQGAIPHSYVVSVFNSDLSKAVLNVRSDGPYRAALSIAFGGGSVFSVTSGGTAIANALQAKDVAGLIDVSAFGASGSSAFTSGTIAAGGNALVLANAEDFSDGQGIWVAHAGSTAAVTNPGAPVVTLTGTNSAGNCTYQIAALDGNGGESAASPATTVSDCGSIGHATNGVEDTWETVEWDSTGANGYAVYGTAGGAEKLLDIVGIPASLPAWTSSTNYNLNDLVQPRTSNGHFYKVTTAGESGTTEPIWCITARCTVTDGTETLTEQPFTFRDDGKNWGAGSLSFPASISATAPISALADALVTTVSAGGGTTTLTLKDAATTTAASQYVFHDDTAAINAALIYAGSRQISVQADPGSTFYGTQPGVLIPSGTYYISGSGLSTTAAYLNIASPQQAIIQQQNATQPILTDISVIKANLDGATLVGGYDQLVLGNGNTDASVWTIHDMEFRRATDRPFRFFSTLTSDYHMSLSLDVTDCRFMDNRAVTAIWADVQKFSHDWIEGNGYTSAGFHDAEMWNGEGELDLTGVVGIPPVTPARPAGLHWITNANGLYGLNDITVEGQSRFSSESGGGLPLIYNYAGHGSQPYWQGARIILRDSFLSGGGNNATGTNNDASLVDLFALPTMIRIDGVTQLTDAPPIHVDSGLNLDLSAAQAAKANPSFPQDVFKISFANLRANNVCAADFYTSGWFDEALTPYITDDGCRFLGAAPKAGFWGIGETVHNWTAASDGTAGWVTVRAGQAAPVWQASTAYTVGQFVVPIVDNGHVYECTTAGTSGVSPPTWDTATGTTTLDNGVVWTEVGTNAKFAPLMYSAQSFSNGNAQSAFPSGVTANQLSLYAMEIPTALQASKISYWVDAGDATTTDAYSLGVYNSSGTLVAHVVPIDWQYSGTARTDSLVEGTVTLPAGMYFVGLTGDAVTATLYSVCGAQKSFVDFASSSYAATTSGALPASITAPTLAPAQGCAPYIFLSK